MTLTELARHLDVIARVATTTAKYLIDLDKEIQR